MTNSKSTKRALLTSSISLILCFAMLIGTTFAWFTDSVSTGINKIQSGNLDVELYHMNFADAAAASDWSVGFGIPKAATGEKVESDTKLFLNEEGEEMLWEPGATSVESFRIKNEGSLALKYQFKIEFANATKTPEGKTLADIINISAEEINYDDNGVPTGKSGGIANLADRVLGDGYMFEGYLLPDEQYDFWVALQWVPSEIDNEFNVKGGLSIDLGVALLATQYTYEKDNYYYGDQYDKDAAYPEIESDVWDGTVDTLWYNDTDTEFKLNSAEQLAGLAKLVDGGNTFEGKTVVLASDADLYCMGDNGEPVSFDPIGDKSPFKGTFDGNGHTISNLYQSGWAFNYEWGKYGSIGLFGEVENATIKNVTISGAEAQIEGGDIGGITGSATGTCVFENITIKDSDFGTYNNGIGGIIGWSGAGNYTFKNINIASDVVLGGLWGSFDSSIGGVVGQGEPGATSNFENVDIACRLDAYNDVTAAYKYYIYRMCGMLIGRLEETTTIDGKNYPDMSKYNITCKNVTVTYGDWVDYHYCVVAGKTAWRVEPGYAYGGIPTDHDHSTCAMHCNLLLTFDSLFGGAQYGVNGITSYDGVKVVYNNK